MMSSIRRTRLLKELVLLNSLNLNEKDNQNIKIKMLSDFDFNSDIGKLLFEIVGPEGTPFEGQRLKLEMKVTDRYMR